MVASNGTCSIELVDTETVNINPTPDVTLAVAPSSGLICSSTATNIVVTGSELGVSYQLRNNAGNVNIGVPVAGANGNISMPTGNLTASTTFNVFATIGSCSAQLTATASVAIRPVGDPACGGGALAEATVQTLVLLSLRLSHSQAVMTGMPGKFLLRSAEAMLQRRRLELSGLTMELTKPSLLRILFPSMI